MESHLTSWRVDLSGRSLGPRVFEEHISGSIGAERCEVVAPRESMGLRLTAGLALLASAVLGERLLHEVYGPAGRWGAALAS